MLRKFYLSFIIIVLAIYGLPSYSVNFKYQLKNITVNDGLSQHDISSITQDKYGFIWIATYNGLIRYDGYSFRTFRFNSEDSLSISDNRILSVFVDSDKNLWISTEGGGVNLYSYEKETFKHIVLSTNPLDKNVYTAYEDDDKNIWFGTGGGIYKLKYDADNNDTQIEQVLSGYSKFNNAHAILADYKNNIYLGTSRGLYYLSNTNNNTNNNASKDPISFDLFENKAIFCMANIDSYNALIGSEIGLFQFNHPT